MKNIKKCIAGFLVIISALALNPISVHAAWRQDSHGWWYTEGNSWATGWREIDGSWYYFYSNGYMAKDTMIDGYAINIYGQWMHNIRWTSTGYCEDCGTITGKGIDGIFLCDRCQAKKLGFD